VKAAPVQAPLQAVPILLSARDGIVEFHTVNASGTGFIFPHAPASHWISTVPA
jgi:hypothetical protein